MGLKMVVSCSICNGEFKKNDLYVLNILIDKVINPKPLMGGVISKEIKNLSWVCINCLVKEIKKTKGFKIE